MKSLYCQVIDVILSIWNQDGGAFIPYNVLESLTMLKGFRY